MKNLSVKKLLMGAALLAAMAHTGLALAYGLATGITLDAVGNNASATDLAQINCPAGTHHASAAVLDQSAPVAGLLVSVHLLKDPQMTTATDQVSGDGGFSDIVSLNGGAGPYYLSVRKTNVGARVFTVGWDCRDANNNSTGTDIKVLQVQ